MKTLISIFITIAIIGITIPVWGQVKKRDETQKGKTTWRFPSEGKITWLEKVVTKDYDDCMRETANRWEPCMKTCPDPFHFVVDTRIIKFGLRDDGVVVWREVIK